MRSSDHRPGSDLAVLHRLPAAGRYASPPTLSIAATAGAVGREAEDLGLANLAARTAAAARRVLSGLSLDPRRDISILRNAHELLVAGAAGLEDGPPRNAADSSARHESYAFARLTYSALADTQQRGGVDDEQHRLRTASELRGLADNIRTLLDEDADNRARRDAATELNAVFNAMSAGVLRSLGKPGDSLGGTSLGLQLS